MTVLLVAGAGALGVLARYGLTSVVEGTAVPWTTAAINVGGCFALGMLVGAPGPGAEARAVVGAGFLGGFTTFSAFGLQAWLDAESGHAGRALAYVLVSVVAGVLAAGAGLALGRALA